MVLAFIGVDSRLQSTAVQSPQVEALGCRPEVRHGGSSLRFDWRNDGFNRPVGACKKEKRRGLGFFVFHGLRVGPYGRAASPAVRPRHACRARVATSRRRGCEGRKGKGGVGVRFPGVAQADSALRSDVCPRAVTFLPFQG